VFLRRHVSVCGNRNASRAIDGRASADDSFLVFFKWPITGIIVEFVGFVGLFGWVQRSLIHYLLTRRSFFPVILQALRQTPVIGTFLSLPYIRGVS